MKEIGLCINFRKGIIVTFFICSLPVSNINNYEKTMCQISEQMFLRKIIRVLTFIKQVTVAERFKACTVFARYGFKSQSGLGCSVFVCVCVSVRFSVFMYR
jgi:hypothetical protein